MCLDLRKHKQKHTNNQRTRQQTIANISNTHKHITQKYQTKANHKNQNTKNNIYRYSQINHEQNQQIKNKQKQS